MFPPLWEFLTTILLKTSTLLDICSVVFGLIAVKTYFPAGKLIDNFAVPFASVLRLYITPLILNVTLVLANGLPSASVKLA